MMRKKIVVIGAGYVGLDLAIAFSKKYNVICYDISKKRIQKLKRGLDSNKQHIKKKILNKNLIFTDQELSIKNSEIYIVTVPTPIDENKHPNLKMLKEASILVAKSIKKKSIIIYESTTYPGCTEEFCIPIIEKNSNFIFQKDFNVAYSPERVNPGDKINTLNRITKIVGANDKHTLLQVTKLYKSICKSIYQVKSIKISESAKVIENVQRDINIALVNELGILFQKLNIPTNDVLKAASSKWNFHYYKPGLVGGHCIGVDPYYLTYKAQSVNYSPQVILSGRRINDNMGRYVARDLLKHILQLNLKPSATKILILGLTFKEDCPDVRNSKVFDIYHELENFGYSPQIYDPFVKTHPDKKINKNLIISFEDIKTYNVLIFAVAHKEFKKLTSLQLSKILNNNQSIIYDVKSIFYKKKFVKKYNYHFL